MRCETQFSHLRRLFKPLTREANARLERYLDRLSFEDDSVCGLAEPSFDKPALIVAVKSAFHSALSSFLGLYNISSVLHCKRLLRVSTAVAQALHNSSFRLVYSSSGLISLNRVHDKYDTDYIAAGSTLSDLLIRYRSMGAKNWKKASAAMLETRSQRRDSVFFTIGELWPTIATSAGLGFCPFTGYLRRAERFFPQKMCKLIFSSEAAPQRSRFQGKEAINS